MKYLRMILFSLAAIFALILVFSVYSACWTEGSTSHSYISQSFASCMLSLVTFFIGGVIGGLK